jgi:hypothetical protein
LQQARLSFQCEPGCDVVLLLLQDALVWCWRGRLAEPEPPCLLEKLDFAFPFAAATVSLSLSLALTLSVQRLEPGATRDYTLTHTHARAHSKNDTRFSRSVITFLQTNILLLELLSKLPALDLGDNKTDSGRLGQAFLSMVVKNMH